MRTVLVRGLDGEGPGDILGAFVGETEVEPDSVGDIEIEDGEATVEVPESEVDEVVETMDGNEVGGSEVSVVELDDEAEEIRNYVDEYTSLVELEREEEMRRHEQEIRSLSGEERESKGRSLLGMRGRDEGESLGGYEVKFVKGSGEELPEHEVSVGDLVMVSKQDPLRDDNPTGTVTEVTNHSITLSFDREPQGFVFDGGLRLDLYVNDITYQRMKDALESLLDADGNLKRIRGILVGTREPEGGDDVAIEGWKNDDLNETQREAVRNALGTEDIHLVHGPPGTGKTTTAVEIIRQSVERGDDVLATAASNTAVDNVVELLVDDGTDVVRVGHPARVTPSMRERTLDKVVQEKEKYRRSRELRDEAFEILDEQDGLTHPSGRWRRGLSDERIHELAEQGRGSRGVPPEKIQEMSEWLDLQEEADELFERSEKLEDEAVREVLEDADVVCTTNSTAGSRMMDGVQFDTLVIDEATQATEPSCLIPVMSAEPDRVVMAGDHRQLPPTVKNREADDLRETAFEKLAGKHDETVDMLGVQYRMNSDIMEFPSREFYDGELVADGTVEDHTLDELVDDAEDEIGDHPALSPEPPVVFVDTSEVEAPERSREGSTSYENVVEAELVERFVEKYVDAGVDPGEIAVISPYDDQVDRIKRGIGDRLSEVSEEIEVDTVDGFQGREKEVVFVSLVRSNDEGEVGFLTEERRFNVSVTRARRKLVVVGDSDTVGSHDVYSRFVEEVERRGKRVRA